MTRRLSRATMLSIIASLLTLSGAAAARSAGQPGPASLLTEAEIFLELNDTDGDLGIHGSIDGGPWTHLEIEGPNERPLLDIVSRARLSLQGMTQLAFESAEPSFDELAPEEFLRRFPEGKYEVEARAQDGRTFEATARLSHVLAAPPKVSVSGIVPSTDCEVSIPLVPTPVVIDWDPVAISHPTIGKPGPVQISRYQVFVERKGVSLGLDLPPDVTEFRVPPAVIALGSQFKFEVIARTTAGNNTAVESCFRVR